MFFTICPITSVPFKRIPLHLSLSMLKIVSILSEIFKSIFPVKLPDTMHFPFRPLTNVTVALSPLVKSVSMEKIIFELTDILL